MPNTAVNLPDDVQRVAQARAAETGHGSVQDYVADLIRADAERPLSEELERAMLEGLDSGDPIEVTPAFWQQIKRSM